MSHLAGIVNPMMEALPGEEFRYVAANPNYQVSNMGRVWSIQSSKLLKPSRNTNGYLKVSLGRSLTRTVHTLVAEAFHGPCPPGMEARHGNGTRDDNRAENLSWGTHADNCRDIVEHGNHWRQGQTHCLRGHEFTPENTLRRKDQPNNRECRTCRKDRRAA